MNAIKILGSILSSGALSRGSGSNVLGSVIGALTGGGSGAATSGGGGLGSLIGGMLGGGSSPRGGGGLGGMLGGGQSGGGGLGGLLGGLMGGGSGGGAGLGSLLGAAMSQIGGGGGTFDPGQFFSQEHDQRQVTDQATLMVRAMINAAKADGQVDQQEQQRILGQLGEVTQDEIEFVRHELSAPLDMEAFVRSIPEDLAQQVYTMSLMAIDLDSQAEAQYLHRLAQGTGISAEVSNAMHEQLGAPKIYR
ncbi:MAG: tellurite resistance TerB family protein [Gammaproteobacteria bacterium]|nr:tellurite resistance TerB family protein [Gammaproteobacteria bacterium]